MSLLNLRLIFIAVLSSLLSSCVEQPTLPAPVITPNDPTQAQNLADYYVVKKGDTLYAISLIFNLDYRQLAQSNQIPPPYTIAVGQKIAVPKQNKETKPSPDNRITAANKIITTITRQNSVTATNRMSSQTKDLVALNNKPATTNNPPYKAPPTKISAEKTIGIEEKKPTISIDNGNMLKLNFQWPLKGRILKSFTQADSKGIDIAGKIGQEVKAAESGKVVYSGQGLIGYGNLLIIKHNDMYLSAYAHNSELLVAEGHAVKKGEVIAKVGHAGTHKTSLYFEIRKHGKPVNPLSLLPKKQ